jgi:type VI secretion system secreted protein VgrG
MAIGQATRLLNLTTPLGKSELVLTSFSGREEISRLFRFQLEMISDNNAVKAADIVGKRITFGVRRDDESARPFNGFVSRFIAGDEDETGRRNYRAEVVPWLWFLTRNSNCRIFQNKSVPDIIEQVFRERGFADFKPKLNGGHPKREYCVQYDETDFNFVSRLMEEEGIFYFFKHNDGAHTMILADKASCYVECLEKEVDFPRDYGSMAFEDFIQSWEHRYEFRTGRIAHTDYNFETPSTNLLTNETTVVQLPGEDKYERYEYPGLYGNTSDGRALAQVRMEEEEVEHDVVDATSLCKTFTPGGKFKVRQHHSATEKGKSYVITSIEHKAYEPHGHELGAAGDAGYRNRFTCIPDRVTFRPARLTAKPRVQGLHTAIVVGPAGEEIFTDKYGRVKVQFHWDREGKHDENSSCWVRVSQLHAGKGFGAIDLPRIGEEVVIGYPDGSGQR